MRHLGSLPWRLGPPWLLLAVLATRPLCAQGAVIRVVVTDSASRSPVANAQVSIVRGLNSVIASGVADSAGRRTFTIPSDSAAYQVVARAIGFTRSSRFFVVRWHDTLSIALTLARLPQELAPVKVTAEEDIKHKRLFIDADAIANSPRLLYDGVDILTKLRPDMVWGLGGRTVCNLPVQNIWVNGKQIYSELVPIDQMAIERAKGTALKPAPAARGRTVMRQPPSPVPDHVLSVLASIKPEHIEEMTYHDCMDYSVGKIGSDVALFVVLKPGIGFEPGRGSYVLDGPVPAAQPAPRLNASATPPRPAPLPAYRRRVLGVFDLSTGSPLDSCSVTDVASGTRALTTSTGTVSLAYLPEGTVTLRLEKSGYQSSTMTITISPADSSDVTVVLTPAGRR